MRTWIKWFIVNALFVAFFVFQAELPLFLWNGGYFLIWIITLGLLVLMVTCLLIAAFYSDDSEFLDGARVKFQEIKKPDFYYKVDAIFDLCMVFVLAGLGHYVYAVFYALANLSMIFFRNLLRE